VAFEPPAEILSEGEGLTLCKWKKCWLGSDWSALANDFRTFLLGIDGFERLLSAV
jgi:hypothetical protein